MTRNRLLARKSLLLVVALHLLLLAAGAARAGCVVMVNSYHPEYKWVAAYHAAFVDELQESASLVEIYLDTKRIRSEEFVTRAASALEVIEEASPDVVVLADDNAFSLLAQKVVDMGIPVVFLGLNSNPRNSLTSLKGVVGVLERPLLKRSIPIINEVLGKEFKKFLVLFDVSTTSDVLFRDFFLSREVRFQDYLAEVVQVPTYEEWKEAVLQAPARGFEAIMLGVHNTLRDGSGAHVPYREVARWTNQHSTIPVFAFWDFSVSPDMACGGLVLAADPQGRAAARLTNMILNGRNVSSIHSLTAERGKLMFSRGGLQRWGLKLVNQQDEPVEIVD